MDYILRRINNLGIICSVLQLFPTYGDYARPEPEAISEHARARAARRMNVDINCDLGEGEAPARTRALMKWITSANIACGGHAGTARSMDYCARLAHKMGVRVGAHPGFCDPENFGRRPHDITPAQLELLLLQQVGALEKVAQASSTKLHHVKLHGALYHVVESDTGLAQTFVETVARHWPKAKVYAAPHGNVAELAPAADVKIWHEAFADRAYMTDGTLVPRNVAGAVLGDIEIILGRVRRLLREGEVESISGALLKFKPGTLCVHGDTPEALRIVQALRTDL